MAGATETSSYLGHVLHDGEGHKIGKVDNLFTGAGGTWAAVISGIFPPHTHYIPVDEARLTDAGLTVPYTAETVKNAPDARNLAGTLNDEDIANLTGYYRENHSAVRGESREPGVLEVPFTGSSSEATFGTGEPGAREPGDTTQFGT